MENSKSKVKKLSNDERGLITAIPPRGYKGTRKAWILALERLSVIKYNAYWRKYPGWAIEERIRKNDICVAPELFMNILSLAESIDDETGRVKNIL